MTENTPLFHVVGGGLAGVEAAWQLISRGCRVRLHEMRPVKTTPAHKTSHLAELVCSNSLKSTLDDSAAGLLKREMAAMSSLVIAAAEKAKVPAGQALAVDRDVFSSHITDELSSHPGFEICREEVKQIPTAEQMQQQNEYWIIASGPLTSEALSEHLKIYTGDKLYFYDAIAPVVAADSVDLDVAFYQSRYDKQESSEVGDYLNVPLTKEEYETFIDDLLAAEYMPLHNFEKEKYFESCLPIEVMVARGRETLRFGPMKPVGLEDPRTGRRPWAAIQLRRENMSGTMLSLVGFQTKMKWPEQKRIFSKLAAFKDVEILKYGSIHRNTYLEGPKVLAADLSAKDNPRVFFAGQMIGVEGYTESASMGLLAGRAAFAKSRGEAFLPPPEGTICGALLSYVTGGGLGEYSPMNVNMGLLPPIEKTRGVGKKERRKTQCDLARKDFDDYMARVDS